MIEILSKQKSMKTSSDQLSKFSDTTAHALSKEEAVGLHVSNFAATLAQTSSLDSSSTAKLGKKLVRLKYGKITNVLRSALSCSQTQLHVPSNPSVTKGRRPGCMIQLWLLLCPATLARTSSPDYLFELSLESNPLHVCSRSIPRPAVSPKGTTRSQAQQRLSD